MKLGLSIASKDDLLCIHEASLRILRETGCIFHSEKALATLKKHGAGIDGKTVYFHKELVDQSMETVPRSFNWRARNDSFSTVIGNGGFRRAPNAGNIYVQDISREPSSYMADNFIKPFLWVCKQINPATAKSNNIVYHDSNNNQDY